MNIGALEYWIPECAGMTVNRGAAQSEFKRTGNAVQGRPIAIARAAARNGNGSETAARNQTNRSGMKGISHKIMRWKANSAQAIT